MVVCSRPLGVRRRRRRAGGASRLVGKWRRFFIRAMPGGQKFPIHRPYEGAHEGQKAQLWDGMPSKEYGPIRITPYFDFLRATSAR